MCQAVCAGFDCICYGIGRLLGSMGVWGLCVGVQYGIVMCSPRVWCTNLGSIMGICSLCIGMCGGCLYWCV